MKIYNTLSGKIEELKPIKPKEIKLFVCGITTQDSVHIGHAKTYCQFDFIVKYLRHKGYNIFYLQNITDIDDRIIQRAKEEKTNFRKVSDKFEKEYFDGMAALKVDSVTKYARATDYIPQIVKQVKTLIKKGFAYKIDDGYYFDLSKFPDYGKLSKRTSQTEEDSVSRIDESVNKKNKGDFCLWKFSKKDEPSWETELGEKGRPGWHIEDTAITENFFGVQYDIHGGARDLIFPHHEAEIAQMESASGKKPLVRYWMHTGFLNVKGKKMSKSKKNFITLKAVLKKYDYRLIRYFFLTNHYRMPIDFNNQILQQSKGALDRLNDFVLNTKQKKDNVDKKLIEKKRLEFYGHLDNDFDTPRAFAILFDFIREANKQGPGEESYKFLEEINSIFDFLTLEQQIPKEILELAQKRERARQQKDFKLSDKIRQEILKKGYQIDDTPEGFKLKKL